MQDQEKPKVPDGYRELKLGEKLQPGDLKWIENKWGEMTAVEQLTVRSPGQYCRKIETAEVDKLKSLKSGLMTDLLTGRVPMSEELEVSE